MRLLFVHNYYQSSGGEDGVVAAETRMLEERGHAVRLFSVDNDSIRTTRDKLKVSVNAVYSREAERKLREAIREFRPDVVHVHNFFPMLTPAVFWACREEGVRAVQTLHNFRWAGCLNAFGFRDGAPCEDCFGKPAAWSGIRHRCYRDSFAGSAVVATMLASHRAYRTWETKIDRFFVPSRFLISKLVETGIPEEKLLYKPNFVPVDPGRGRHAGGYALFVGRLSAEKGIEVLLEAWSRIGGRIPLKIAGSGPLEGRVREAASRVPGIEWLGQKPQAEVRSLMKDALFQVLPSIWYEVAPLVLFEAFACGTPVIASRLGGIPGFVEEGRTGLLFEAGKAEALAAAALRLSEDSGLHASIAANAREEFERKYAVDQGYAQSIAAYEQVLCQR